MSMVVYRVERTHDFVVMSNAHLYDAGLSCKAKGLLSLLLALPADWVISVGGLAELSSDGVDSVKSGMRELGEAGYITKTKLRGPGGTFGGWEYVIREMPIDANCTESGKSTLGEPKVEKPTVENPLSDTIEKQNIIPPIVPQKGDTEKPKKKPKETVEWMPTAFAAWYAAYPRHVSKEAARKAWNKLRPDEALVSEMMAALAEQKRSAEWTEDGGRYVPHPSTYLHQQRWTDELTPPAEDFDGEEEMEEW